MIDKKPDVSIGMPVYNGAQHIRQALDSLLDQDYKNFELIISDNASTDETQDICKWYIARDKRIRYYRNENNVGAIQNFNSVFAISQGDYFMWASCHDLWEKTFISRCVDILKKEHTVVLCYPLADWISANGDSLGVISRGIDTRGLDRMSRSHALLWSLQFGYPIHGIIRTSMLKQTKSLRPVIGQDLVLLFEFSLLGEFAHIPEAMLHIRRAPDYGSWNKYIERCFGRKVNGFKRRWLFWSMLFEYLRIINRHICSIPARVFLMFSTLLCILVRYRWIKQGISKRK
ncbi:MAG TPA: hypothetical protein DCY56_04720 [Candidatus Omnitrophica bacterium]|nr:hypothetical protein [Candidatus Omnitrophota bacterium]